MYKTLSPRLSLTFMCECVICTLKRFTFLYSILRWACNVKKNYSGCKNATIKLFLSKQIVYLSLKFQTSQKPKSHLVRLKNHL